MIYLDSYAGESGLVSEGMAIGLLENYGDEAFTPFGLPDGETRRYYQKFKTIDDIGRCNLRGDSIGENSQDFFYPTYQYTEEDLGDCEHDCEHACVLSYEPSEEDGIWLKLYLAKQEDDLNIDHVSIENSSSIQLSPEIQAISIVRSSYSSRRTHAGNYRSHGRRGRK